MKGGIRFHPEVTEFFIWLILLNWWDLFLLARDADWFNSFFFFFKCFGRLCTLCSFLFCLIWFASEDVFLGCYGFCIWVFDMSNTINNFSFWHFKKEKEKKKPKYEYVSIVKTLFYFLGFGGSNYHTTFFLQYVGGRIESLTSRLIVH